MTSRILLILHYHSHAIELDDARTVEQARIALALCNGQFYEDMRLGGRGVQELPIYRSVTG